MPSAIGVQTPTYRSVQTGVDSYGTDAVDIARVANQECDPWQSSFLVDAMAVRADGKWAARDVGLIVPRQNGKGGVLEALVLAHLFLIGETRLILWTAHEFKTAEEAFLRMKGLIESSPYLLSKVRIIRTQSGKEGIELKDGTRLRFLARSKASGRGFSADLVILDEAYDLTDIQLSAILPTVLARPNPQIWYTSSAPLPTSVVLRRLCKRGRSKGSGLTYAEWCATPGESLDPLDRKLWRQANPGYGIRIEDEAIQGLYDSMDAEDFEREVLGIWNTDDDLNTAIDLEAWASLALSDFEVDEVVLNPGDVCALAVDVTPDRKYAAIGAASMTPDGFPLVEVVQVEKGTSWVVERLVGLNDTHEPIVVVIDERSPAASLVPELRSAGFKELQHRNEEGDLEPNRDEGEILLLTNTADLADACGFFYDAVEDSKIVRHLNDPDLNTAIRGATWRPLGDARAWSRSRSDSNIAPLVAVTLALHGLRLYGDVELEEQDAFVFFR